MNILEISNYLKSLNLQEELSKRIGTFHDLCGQPLTGTCAEGVLVSSFKKLGITVNWNPMSHSQDLDMSLTINEQIVNLSLKSSKMNSKRIPISSYRTTSAKTLNEKLELIEKLDSKLDAMFVFSRYHSGKNVFPDYYKIYLINPEFLNPKHFEWKEDRNKNGDLKGWRTCKNSRNVNLGLVESLSSQLWCDISKECLVNYPDVITELMEIVV